MAKQFNQVVGKQLKTLGQYVPIVERVHGDNHPEFHEVRKVFDALVKKAKDAGNEKPDLNEQLTQLRKITDNYKVPDDVCESYEAVYKMLEEVDQAYQA